MSAQLQFELTAPQKTAFNKPVAMVTVPSGRGMYGVLPGHAPMITDVAPGIVEIYENDENSVTGRVFVTGGTCEVTTDGCFLMADDILQTDGFSRAAIEEEIAVLIRARGELTPEESEEEIETKLAIEIAKLQAIA